MDKIINNFMEKFENIALCMRKIEDSFFEFMLKLSNDEYEDVEEYLE